MEKALARYLGEVFVAFVMVVFVTGIGSVLGRSNRIDPSVKAESNMPLRKSPT